MTTARAILVDGPQALAMAGRNYPDCPVMTDNPFLARLERNDRLLNADALVGQPETLALGCLALDMAGALDASLTAHRRAQGGVDSWPSIARPLGVFLSSLIHRAAVLARAVQARPARHYTFILHQGWTLDGLLPFAADRFASPFAALAVAGFLPQGIGHDFLCLPQQLPDAVNDTASDSRLESAAILPTAVLAAELARRLGLDRVLSRFRLPMIGQSEAAREAVPYLLCRRIGVRAMPKVPAFLRSRRQAGASLDLPPEYASADCVDAVFEHFRPQQSAFDEGQWAAIATLTRDMLQDGMARFIADLPILRQYAAMIAQQAGPARLALTQGMSSPQAAYVHQCLDEMQVTTICFEHGVTKGLAALSAYRPELSEVNNCHYFLCASPNAMRDHPATVAAARDKQVVIGLPEQTRTVVRRPLQQRLMRHRLKLAAGDCAIMHISPFPYGGNMRVGHGMAGESVAFDLDRRFIEQVYAGLGKTVFFKPYPTIRLPFTPSYEQLFPGMRDVRFLDKQDFRYVRAAADIVVSGVPTSTLGWCLGTGKPLVYFDSALISPLVDDAMRQMFRDAFFVVDVDVAGWEIGMRDILSRSISDITADWNAKAAARQALLDHAIFGPRGRTGERAAQFIASLLDRNSRAAQTRPHAALDAKMG